jgi:hypothetical protein
MRISGRRRGASARPVNYIDKFLCSFVSGSAEPFILNDNVIRSHVPRFIRRRSGFQSLEISSSRFAVSRELRRPVRVCRGGGGEEGRWRLEQAEGEWAQSQAGEKGYPRPAVEDRSLMQSRVA